MFKKFITIYLVLSILILTAGAIGVFWYTKGKSQPSVNQPVVNEVANTNQPTEDKSYEIIPPEKTDCTDELDTACWNIYRNNEYGFEFRYPKDVVVNSGRSIVSEANIDVRYVSFRFLRGRFILSFFFAKDNHQNNLNTRTGFSSGDFIFANREVKFGPVMARVNYFVSDNKIKEVYYSRENFSFLPYDNIEFDHYVFRAELAFEDNSDIEYERDFADISEMPIAEKVLGTMRLR
ncbi:MAG: hypothetical protein WC310_00400 [Patescibacteria group bacterium]|jgi:hypothetical protein